MDSALPRLTSAQAAARLGVKQQTLYAYVSRGLLKRQRDAHGSTFDALEIEAFAGGRRSSASRAEPGSGALPAQGLPLMVLDTDIAFIEDDELHYRGIPVEVLATSASFESVADWLWRGMSANAIAFDSEREVGFVADPNAVASAVSALEFLPAAATQLDRIQACVPMLGAADATRHDLDPDTVGATAARLIGGVVDVLGSPAPRRAVNASIAARLWRALSEMTAGSPELATLNAALVLLVDHDLAVSTLAVRAAASARATPYAAVSSGLGALDSALHGNASAAACELIGLVLAGTDARTALAQTVARTGRAAPGFGQPLYAQADARARILLPLVAALPLGAPVVAAVDALTGEVATHTGRHPNIDLALAAFTIAAGMPADAGAAIFAVSRMAGWIAHALDEYDRRPLRLRPRGHYVGPLP